MNASKVSLGTIGKCIYCGESETNLSEEHIVPLGLGGIWTLKQASCRKCRDITSGFELDVLRQTYLPVRAKMNLPTRHKDKRPDTLPITIKKAKRKETINVPIEKHPTILLLPSFKDPAYIDKRKYEKGIDLNGLYQYQFNYPTFKDFGRDIGADSVSETVTFRGFKGGFSFARLLAKIAYGFAIAHFGIIIYSDNYLLPSILGQTDTIGKWVGSRNRQFNISDKLHEIILSVKDGDIYCYIRLYANLKGLGPEYIVVVGPAPNGDSNSTTNIKFDY